MTEETLKILGEDLTKRYIRTANQFIEDCYSGRAAYLYSNLKLI